jgi:hydrogenase expression/formation protein HypE
MEIMETDLPVRPGVAGACEILGLDPLYVANEGKLVAFIPPEQADAALAAARAHPLGVDAAIIGTVTEDPDRFVEMQTAFGGRRMIDWIAGEQLPRIC